MTAGMYIVAVCAVGGLIAGAAFWWAVRSGQLTDASEAKYLVFDDEDEIQRPGRGELEDQVGRPTVGGAVEDQVEPPAATGETPG
jgi:cbb3-type cytochrome oxidase maturation protein